MKISACVVIKVFASSRNPLQMVWGDIFSVPIFAANYINLFSILALKWKFKAQFLNFYKVKC